MEATRTFEPRPHPAAGHASAPAIPRIRTQLTYAPVPSIRLYSFQGKPKVGHLTAGLGCPNGCDFCCTSHFFKRKYVPYLKTGAEIYEAIRSMEKTARARGDRLHGFVFIDEDFFLYKRRAREFLEAVRRGGKPLALMGFGSVRGLSQFTADEIAEMGFDTIWTAVESSSAGYGKLQGRSLTELYGELKARGVAILSSMIIGFPYQDRKQVLDEFDRLMALGPTLTQILIYFAFPGTPFHAQVIAEDRYLPEYRHNPDLRRWDGFAMHFKHPRFTAPELEGLQRDLYRWDFERLGPSIVRLLRVWHQGYINLKDSPNPLLRARAERKRKELRVTLPALVPAMIMGPSRAARVEARQLYRDVCDIIGPRPLSKKLQGLGMPALAAWTWLADKLGIFQQPGLLRVEHRLPDGEASPASIMRLQGGFHAGPLAMVGEDLRRIAGELATRAFPHRRTADDGFPTGAVTRPAAPAETPRKLRPDISNTGPYSSH